ncbi:3-oxoacyl-ACP synthase III family protein [Kitasatospora sp. NPDC056138]|uniref:3-oxoacyl-ACP synthase III family protein n=1 Tax=Kitasatospora sp. NPDC056138 TaxID=3345724 RepID=UPI0035D748B1
MTRAAVLEGLGAMVPPRIVSNDEIGELVGSDDTWIRTRTGIRQRHWADPGTVTGDLAIAAGERAMESAGGGRVDLVVLATSTPNQPMPATAPEIAHRLDLGNPWAYDLSAACTGWVYGMANAVGAISSGLIDRALVIGADIWSTRLDHRDRASAIIFGDGAGAAVLRAGDPDEPGAFQGFDLGSDGEFHDLALLAVGGSRQRSHRQAPREEDNLLAMRGKELFSHAVDRMSSSSAKLLDRIGWDASDVDWLAGHQANSRILYAVSDLLAVDRERVLLHIDRVGNTSAASIPLALTHAGAAGTFDVGDRIFSTTFGVGLNWGSTALTWPDIKVSEVLGD